MLKTMVPLAVAHELRDGSAQEKRFLGDSIGLSVAEESVLNDFEARSKPAEDEQAEASSIISREISLAR
jgi:hypothetical protein